MRTLDKNEIQKILPHRPPMLLIDKVIEIEAGQRIVAVKDVTLEEDFLKGHFPNRPIMPGTSIVEAMAQTAILLYYTDHEDVLKGTMPEFYLGSINKTYFTHPVVPGDRLRLVAQTIRSLPNGGCASVKAFVGDKQVAETELVFIVKNDE